MVAMGITRLVHVPFPVFTLTYSCVGSSTFEMVMAVPSFYASFRAENGRYIRYAFSSIRQIMPHCFKVWMFYLLQRNGYHSTCMAGRGNTNSKNCNDDLMVLILRLSRNILAQLAHNTQLHPMKICEDTFLLHVASYIMLYNSKSFTT